MIDSWHWLLRLYPGCSQFQRPPWRTRPSVRPQLCPAGTSWTWCTVSIRPCKRELPRVHSVEAWENKPGRSNQLRRWLDESINMQLDSKLESKHHFLTFYFLTSFFRCSCLNQKTSKWMFVLWTRLCSWSYSRRVEVPSPFLYLHLQSAHQSGHRVETVLTLTCRSSMETNRRKGKLWSSCLRQKQDFRLLCL